MMLWLVIALMTAATACAVLWPFSRLEIGDGGSDLAVYRDQLNEIGRDQIAGLICNAEAETAKVEISRRLIAAADTAEAGKRGIRNTAKSKTSPLWRRRSAVIFVIVLLPVGTILFYLTLGSPQLLEMPLATRVQAQSANSSIEGMIAEVEDYVTRNPNDGRAWEVLAPVYVRVGRFDDAAKAWRNTISLNGDSASREADLGEALVAAGNGVVTTDAKAAFDRALAFDPNDVMARFYNGMAADQNGRRADAETIWRELLANAPPGAPWIEIVQHAMARNAPKAWTASRMRTQMAGPTAADIAAAAKLAPDQQDEMIRGMVARLAARLTKDSSDAEGWVRLVRSYRVLGQSDKADAAIANARRALANDPDKLRRFSESIESEVTTAKPAVAPTLPAAAGPTAADIAAAAQMNPDEQNQMVRGMVARLADKLKADGTDIRGWQRLLRSYITLGERDKAQAAAGDARRAFASDPDQLRQIEDTIKSLGLS
jgi:cytochrome c-type biogenesis protein CcmH